MLAQWLGIKAARITLISGAASRQKRFLIEGIDPPGLLAHLAAVLARADS